MSKQTSLEQFFKMKGCPSPQTMSEININKKRRSLSLIKPSTPKKTFKIICPSENVIKKESEVIDLCSDDENASTPEGKFSGNWSQNSLHNKASNTSTPEGKFRGNLSQNSLHNKASNTSTPEGKFRGNLSQNSLHNKASNTSTPEGKFRGNLSQNSLHNKASNTSTPEGKFRGNLSQNSLHCKVSIAPIPEGKFSGSLSQNSIYRDAANASTSEGKCSGNLSKNSINRDAANASSPEGKFSGNLSQNSIHSEASNASTIIYNYRTPTTPQKSPKSSSNSPFRSPNSAEKYYSPTKKRGVAKKTPTKRNLAKLYFGNSSQPHSESIEDEHFNEAIDGMDDKSIFFLTIINKFLKDDSLKKLLDDKSIEVLSDCLHIVKPGIRLVCRLYWRKRVWYRKEQMIQITNDKKKISIGNSLFEEILKYLVEKDIITVSANNGTNKMTFDDYTEILKREQIIKICKDLKLKIQSKEAAVDALRALSKKTPISKYFTGPTSNNEERVLKFMQSEAGTCYKLSDVAISTLYKLYLLMYLGMNYGNIREKKLELILIHEKIKRETYPVDKGITLDNASVVFKNSDEFNRYCYAHLIYEDYIAETETSKKCNYVLKVYNLYNEIDEEVMIRYKSLPIWLRRYTPTYIYIKMLESGVQELKKDKSGKYYQVAIDILTTLISQTAFRQHKKAGWYAEKALVLHKLMARHDEAAKVLLEGLKSDLSEEAKDVMRPRANKIANQLNIELAPGLSEALREFGSKELILEKSFHAEHISKPHMETYNQRGKKKFEVHTENGKKYLDAEEYCAYYYTSCGEYTNGEHWEGRIVTTIFYLLFWDIIYTKPRGVEGVFLSHYQLHPLDMYTDSFYTNRKTSIDDRLMAIEKMDTDQLVNTMQLIWDERPIYELSGINRNIAWEDVRAVAACLGAPAAAALCRRLAAHYGYAHSGFPDLTLWNSNTGKIKFVEVKTDTDKPSMKQLQWMQYLRAQGVDAGFCYVGASTTRTRARASQSSM